MKKKFMCLRTVVAVMMCVLMSATFTSCDDKDEDGKSDNNSSSLVGKWKTTYYDDSWETWEFFSNGILRIYYCEPDQDYEEEHSRGYSVKGNQLRVEGEDDGEYILGTFTINGNQLTYTCRWYYDGDVDDEETIVFTRVK